MELSAAQRPYLATQPVERAGVRGITRVSEWVWLSAILALAAVFRFAGIDWDAGQHLHPDERFLTMVETAMRWPSGIGEYFDTARTPLSPYNNNFNLYVYGTFPLYLVKAVGLLIDRSGYDQIHLVGRFFSALSDVGTTCLVFVIGRRLYAGDVGLLAAGLYALMALPIQQAHFFTVDSYATFFAVLSAYLAIRVADQNRARDVMLLGIAIGFGLACKISMFVLGGFAVLAAALVLYRDYHQEGVVSEIRVWGQGQRLMLAAAATFLTFRVLQPIAFQGPTILNFTPNEQWLSNMAEVRGLTSGERDFPPGHQWTDRPAIWFPLSNMVMWGMGLPLGLVAWLGWVLCAVELVRQRKTAHLLPVAFVGAVFLYQGTQWVKSMRYFLHLYPFLAITAAYLLARIWQAGSGRAPGRRLWLVPRITVGVVIVLTALYAVAFTSIYLRPHSRVEASRWIYDNIPRGAAVANEHWDDALPLRVDGRDGFGGIYRGLTINNYDEDEPRKLEALVGTLVQADYIILSSNRLYDSIPRLPMRYPMTTRYYELLFAEQLGFRKVAEFTSYPSLFGLSLPDQGAEEAWSVYDHPRVQIFQKTPEFDRAQVRAKLGDGIDWESILRLRPDQATKARNGLLLSAADRETYQASGTWRDLFSSSSLGNQAPVIIWWLTLQAVGLVALPLVFAASRSLVDGGYGITKAMGILLVGWLAWMAASLRLTTFGLGAVGASLAVVALVSGIVALTRWGELTSFVRRRWRLLAIEEAVFSLAFLGFVGVRASNPDLWHPVMGGEKPMDFAYLNAVTRSVYFPPYDPWFAGGYINYYYFGFVLVAALVHLTGVVPWVAYNLAVPTFFAATTAAAFAVALNLAQRVPSRMPGHRHGDDPPDGAAVFAGFAGVVGVAIIGNLGQLRLVLGGFYEMGRTTVQIPLLSELLRVTAGAREVLAQGRPLPFRTEWWYWNATRVIEHAAGEAGPINEFPFFTFLYGDLHAHMMALPYTLVALALMVSLLRIPAGRAGRVPLLTAALLALVIGSLWPLNTWDVPTFAALAGAALLLRALVGEPGLTWKVITHSVGPWVGIIGLGYVYFLPFHRSYATAYSSVEPWQGSRTLLTAYIVMHGIALFVILTALVARIGARQTRAPLARELRIMASGWSRAGRARALIRSIVHRTPLQSVGVWLALTVATIGGLLLTLAALSGLVKLIVPSSGPGLEQLVQRLGAGTLGFLVMGLALILVVDQRADARHRFVFLMVAAGAALTLMVEVVVLKGDVSRMNTVFKFYLQVWTFWSLAAAVALPGLLGLIRDRAAASASLPGIPRESIASWWRPAFAALAVAGLLYPVTATYVRARDRFEHSTQVTLDGMAYMDRSVYNDRNQAIPLRWDREAMAWLMQTIPGSPVIVEAMTGNYKWGSRVSIYTGLPTVIGWDGHQRQQRAGLVGDVVDRRINDVNQIFGAASPERTRELLDRYAVRFLYVGQIERIYYPGVEMKMRRYEGSLWNRVYENQEVSIYEVRR